MKGKIEEMLVELIDKKVADIAADYEIIFIVDKDLGHRFVDDFAEFDFYSYKGDKILNLPSKRKIYVGFDTIAFAGINKYLPFVSKSIQKKWFSKRGFTIN